MKEYKKCLEMIRKHLKDETIEFDKEMLDKIVNDELKKPINKMDKSLIDLCLNALVAYRAYTSEHNEKM